MGGWPKRREAMVGCYHSANLPQASWSCWSTTMSHKGMGVRVSSVTQQEPTGPSWKRWAHPHRVLCWLLV